MLPLSDTTPRRRFPFINYFIILTTIFVFLVQLSAPDFEKFIFQYGFVPSRFSFFNLESYRYLIYSIFLHGGFFHIISNLWFLHIFGDNVEDRLGHFSYLVFYLLAGIIAVFAQYFFNIDSNIPMIGASGAISGVAGAYFVLFPHGRIKALVPGFFGFIHLVELPTWFFLGYWFFIQVFSGLGSLVSFDMSSGGVAWFAHIGGFIFGWWAVKGFKSSS